MLRTPARLRKIAVRIFDQRILVPMSKLFFETHVAVMIVFFGFDSAFAGIGIVRQEVVHNKSLLEYSEKMKLSEFCAVFILPFGR
jgi:hypothetical protein